MDCRATSWLAVSVLFGDGIIIEIARSGSDKAIQVALPHSPAPTVRTQPVDAVNGLPRPCGARSFDFTSIEIARRTLVRRGNPSEPAAKFSLDRQDAVCGFYQWTASLRSQFRIYLVSEYSSKLRGGRQSDAAIQVDLPHSSALTVRTQSADSTNGLLRSARSFEFICLTDAVSGLPRRAVRPPRCFDSALWTTGAANIKTAEKNPRCFS